MPWENILARLGPPDMESRALDCPEYRFVEWGPPKNGLDGPGSGEPRTMGAEERLKERLLNSPQGGGDSREAGTPEEELLVNVSLEVEAGKAGRREGGKGGSGHGSCTAWKKRARHQCCWYMAGHACQAPCT